MVELGEGVASIFLISHENDKIITFSWDIKKPWTGSGVQLNPWFRYRVAVLRD